MFESIQISNFRSCKNVRLETEGSVLALVGRNGAGKTNLLTAIDWLCKSATSVEAVRKPGGMFSQHADAAVDVRVRIGDERYRYRLVYRGTASTPGPSGANATEQIDEILENLTSGRDLIRRDGEDVVVIGRSEPIRIAATTPALAALPALLPADDDALKAIRVIVSFFSNVHYYELSDTTGHSYYVTREKYDEWRKAYERDRSATSSVALRLLYMWENDRLAFEEVQAILKSMGIVDRVSVQSFDMNGQKSGTSDATKLYFFFFFPSLGMGGHGQSFNFDDLSAGTRRVIRMIVSLIFDKRSVMLVEQPEDTIHRGMLLKVLDTFRSYAHTTQLLFTTHSSIVLDMLHPEEVRLVSAEDGVTHVRKLTTDELRRAGRFLNETGNLSDFIEQLEDNE